MAIEAVAGLGDVVEFRVLGPFRAVSGKGPIVLGTGRVRLLSMLLLVSPNRPVSDDHLIDGLWPDGPPASAHKNLQGYVHRLRGAIGDSRRIVRDGAGYALVVADDEVDALRFEALVRRALRETGNHRRAALFAEALALWRGSAFAGESEPSWLRDEALRLEELWLTALEERLEADLALGRHQRLVPELRAVVRRHPTHERLIGQLMTALYRCGRRTEALEVYHEFRANLIEDLGLEPSSRLRDLQQAILTTDPSLDITTGPPPHPYARAPWTRPRHPADEVTGRGAERAGRARLVTSRPGPGGAGRTRLALRVTAEPAGESPHGAVVLALTDLADSDDSAKRTVDVHTGDLITELASLLEAGGRGEALWKRIEERLRDQDLLLVLDDHEHLTRARAWLMTWLSPCRCRESCHRR